MKNRYLNGGLFPKSGKPRTLKASNAKNKQIITPEKHIQASFIAWRDIHKREFPILNAIFAVPNSIWAKNKVVAQSMVEQGLTAGISDVICLAPSHDKKFFGLLIEFKSEIGRLTPEQIFFQDFFNRIGYKSVVCRSTYEASTLVNKYLGINVPVYPR